MKLQQFFQDHNDRFSSTRIIALGAFISSTIYLFVNPSESAYTLYITGWVTNFLGSKFMEYKYADTTTDIK